MASWLTAPAATVAVVLAVAGIVGCGASTDSPASMKASVEAICIRRNKAINKVDVKVTSAQLLKQVARGRATVEQTTLNELIKLTPPAANKAGWREFLNYRRILITDWIRLSKNKGEERKKSQALLTAVVTTQEKLLATAKHDGYTSCTQID